MPTVLAEEKREKEIVSERIWTVSGKVTYALSGRPAVGVRVTAMDADLLFHDQLGEGVTDIEGRFRITYSSSQFRDLFERNPDVYLLVYDPKGHLLASTKDAVVRNAGRKQEIFVQLPGAGPEALRPTIQVGGANVDRFAFERLEPDDVLRIARAVFRGDDQPKGLALLEGLSPRLMPEVLSQRLCFTPLRRFLAETVRMKNWPREVALDLEEIFIGYRDYGGYASYTLPNFTINYETSGTDQPPAADTGGAITAPGGAVVGATVAGNGVPDYIEKLGFWLESALATYTNPPFNLRNPAAGGKIPVYVSGLSAGSAGGGSMTIGRALNDDLLAAVPTHELMHLIQELYEASGAGGGWHSGIVEGGAVLGEDVVFDSHNRYVVEASLDPGVPSPFSTGGTLRSPEASLKDPDQSYQLALFLKYISEQQSGKVGAADEPTIGVETYRGLLERFDLDGYTDAAFTAAVAGLPWYQSFHRFDYLDLAHHDEASSETLLGNFWLACYLKDLGGSLPDRRFDFMEDEEDTVWDSLFLGSDMVGTLGTVALTEAATLSPGGAITLSAGAGGSVSPFAARFYKVDVDPGVDTLRVSFSAGAGFAQPLVQVALIEAGNTVRDILRTDHATWERTIANAQAGTNLDHVVIIVAGTETGGPFTLNVTEAAAAPDVTVTRWHHVVGRHYEIDPFGWSWTWVSPDVWVDNNGDGLADSEVFFNQNNRLYIRLHNQGHANAMGINVQLWYQNAAGGLSDMAWLPVENADGVAQAITGVGLAAGATDQWAVDWAPVPMGTSHHFCIRAVVTVPGDPNADNKRCLSNFGNVITAAPYIDLPLMRRAHGLFRDVRVEVIPRTHGRWAVSAADLRHANQATFQRGEKVVDTFRLRKLERLTQHTAGRMKSPAREMRPDPFGHYPTDPRALPPGLEGMPMVTITHVVNGRAVGGFTWVIREAQ